MQISPVRVSRMCDGAVRRVTLSNADSRNVMNDGFFDAMEIALDGIPQLPSFDTKNPLPVAAVDHPFVVLIDADGPSFCAGFDLRECVEHAQSASRFVELLGALTWRIRSSATIVVASVQGAALAGGCALAASCDIVIASPKAKFGYPVHRIGISPAVSLPILARTLSGSASRMLALSGEVVSAAAALRMGLIHRVIEDEAALSSAAVEFAAALAKKGPRALLSTKMFLNRLDLTDDATAAGAATHASMGTAMHEECRTMLGSFWAARSNG
ncbi:MAG: enoyl-CoA hydratase/isomerase family protein [Planctomycetota bacterium]|nr:enoyl-CoA hydratase/isomerase family protein [Planctomycetota bacterium]